jgi:hypothetical protein
MTWGERLPLASRECGYWTSPMPRSRAARHAAHHLRKTTCCAIMPVAMARRAGRYSQQARWARIGWTTNPLRDLTLIRKLTSFY